MDEHLDTSWCPVCDRQIMPKRFVVPVIPPQPAPQPHPQPTSTSTTAAVKQSQTTRGKHGTIKARVQGGGLLHGTGRVRPGGGLRRDSSQNVAALQQLPHPNGAKRLSPQKLAALQQQEQLRQQQAARQAVINQAAMAPRQRTVIDQSQTPLYCSDECLRKDLEFTLSDPAAPQPISRARLGIHPSQLHPERASPPPPSPVLPPVPPNSYRMPAMRLSISEESDSSSATGTSFTNSEASENSPLEDDSRNKCEEWKGKEKEKEEEEGGLIAAARKLSSFFLPDNARQDSAKRELETRLRVGSQHKSTPPPPPPRASDDLPMVSSSHRTESSNAISLSNAQRAQSAIELYSKYPLFTKHSKSKSRGSLAASPTVSASYQPAHAILSASPTDMNTRTHSRVRSTASSTLEGRPRSVDRLSIFDEDGSLAPEFAGRKLNASYEKTRPALAKGIEGRLLLPDVLLKPAVSSSLSEFQRTNSLTHVGMARSRSEANVGRVRPSSSAGVVKSTLGSVKEEGTWHRPQEEHDDAGSEASGTSATGKSSVSGRRRGSGSSRSSKDMSRAGLKLHERGRLNMEACNWSYDAVDGPTYPVMPVVPVTQTRFEEVFVPNGFTPTPEKPYTYLDISELHKRDEVLSRRELREVGRRPGEHNGQQGQWVEKEWEVVAIPERKRLFLFGSGRSPTKH